MDEEAAVMLILAFWAVIAFAIYQRFWVIRRLRAKLEAYTDAAIAAQPRSLSPAVEAPIEPDTLRRIQQRLQVLERIAVEKENALAREIEDLRAAG